MNKSESIKELATALSKANAEISNPKKTSANPFFKSKYADLSEVINVSKPILAEHGLSVVQLPSFADNQVSVETILVHDSGEYISNTLSIPLLKADAQSIGSATTYARRYSLAAICGLAQEDDDGNMAVQQQPKQQPKEEAKKFINPGTAYWDKAKVAFKRDGNLKSVLSKFEMTEENQTRLINECFDEKTNNYEAG